MKLRGTLPQRQVGLERLHCSQEGSSTEARLVAGGTLGSLRWLRGAARSRTSLFGGTHRRSGRDVVILGVEAERSISSAIHGYGRLSVEQEVWFAVLLDVPAVVQA